ncbi:MAG: SDR family oxidoreductase, partial [Sphingorhabdus sp.]
VASAKATGQVVRQDLAGKFVLITGTSSGFGRLTALECMRAGATVIATMRNLQGGRRAEAMALITEAGKLNGKLHLVEIDITDHDQVVSGISAAEQIAGGALDVVVNNAGIGIGGPIELADIEAMQMTMDTNFFGALRIARAALPAMRTRRQGLIINVSSQLGRIIVPNMGIYGSTKFALECASETMAYELAPHGVEVTIIEPGGYPTNIWKSGVRNSESMLARQTKERLSAYDGLVAGAKAMGNRGGGSTDPSDVSKAIVDVIALAPGSRPLRRPVHPDTRATDAINAVTTQVQAAVLGTGPYADWHKRVTS